MDRRLPSHIQQTLAVLWRATEESEYDHQQGIPEPRARQILAEGRENGWDNDAGDEPLSMDEINHRLTFLQNHGEIYYVNAWVRITDPKEVIDLIEKHEYNETD